jgi:hypothetical protein
VPANAMLWRRGMALGARTEIECVALAATEIRR